MSLETLIARYGLLALGIGAIVEGETVLMIAGAMAHRGLMDYGAAVAAASLGSFIGDFGYFLLARRFRDHPRVRRMTAGRAFARAQATFARHPSLFTFGFRFVYGMRTVSPLAIGLTDFPARRFVALNALAAVVWSWLFVSLGYLFGHGIEAAFGRLAAAEHWLLVAAGVGVVALAAHLVWRRRRGPA